jgi:cation transport protein ChaC
VTPQLHVFAYGSLIWRPGFPYLAREAGLLRGYHRRFCLWSRIYRGTPEARAGARPRPRRGLPRGGVPRRRRDAEQVLAYLEERENPRGENVYHRRLLPVRLASGRVVRAVAYVADRRHAAYCRPCEAEAARTIARGHGEAGANRDYLLNTVRHLKELGLRDARLDRLAAMLSP